MSKFCLPFFALLALAACDSNDGVRITRSAEIETDSSDSKALKVIRALQCPSDQGELTRVGSASTDGLTCTYAGPRGAEIKLHLASLDNTTSTAVLERFQSELAPDAFKSDGATVNVVSETKADGTENASVKMPGLKVEAKDDKAEVRIPGMSIEADGDNARIRIGGIVIKSDGNSSTITDENGNLSVKADDTGAVARATTRTAVRATMIHAYTSSNKQGWRVVGYEARGPSSGPIVVATFRTRDRNEDAILESVRELVVLNVGD